jgi:Fe-S-cluster-containing dehydrogenase component
MPVPAEHNFYIDPARCIGCNACVQACSECDTHKGQSMIQLDFIDRSLSPQTVPVICMHCDQPTCAEVCPADAIKRTEDGVVQTARKARCIACNNCVLACPFGVPKMHDEANLMMKCDMCYDRTSQGLKPMCASVCPSQALFFGTREEFERLRPNSQPVDTFRFGAQQVTTKVKMVVPKSFAGNLLQITAPLEGEGRSAAPVDPLLANYFEDGSL